MTNQMKEQTRWLLFLNVVCNMVMGFLLPVNTTFIHKNLHQSLVTAGLALLAYSAMMMVGNILGGFLFDKTSKRKTLFIGYLIATIALYIMAFHHVWPSYVVLLSIVGFGMGIAYTAINSYTAFVADQLPDSRVFFNYMYLASNMGIALGSMSVGPIFNASVFWTFMIPALIFTLCMIIVLVKGNVLGHQNAKQTKKSTEDIPVEKTIDPKKIIGKQRFYTNLIIISLAIFVVWVGYAQWDSNMSVYMQDKGFSFKQYGFVFTVNAASLLIIQPIMNKVATRIFKQLKHQIWAGILIMALSFLILPTATHYFDFLLSMLILTIGESMTFPTIPALLNKLSTDRNRGSIQSLYSVFGSLGRAVGPYVGSLVITAFSYAALFYGITVAMAIGAFTILLVKEI